MSTQQKLVERMTAAANRLASMRARQLLAEMRAEHHERDRARRELVKRRASFGDVIMQCGLGDWSPQEIRGLVLHTLDQTGTSPTVRLGFRKRAEDGTGNARGPPKAADGS